MPDLANVQSSAKLKLPVSFSDNWVSVLGRRPSRLLDVQGNGAESLGRLNDLFYLDPGVQDAKVMTPTPQPMDRMAVPKEPPLGMRDPVWANSDK